MQPYVDERRAYVEPFVGGASVIQYIKCNLRVAYDANEALITMWEAVCNGWKPPTDISEEEYAALRQADDPKNPMTAFAGFGCSFAGKWFGGYARSPSRNYAANACHSIAKKAKGLGGVIWGCTDYRDTAYYSNAVVYCDPPYVNTTGYGAVGTFDTAAFWEFVREMEADGMCVFVSEYTAPGDFESVLEIPTKLDIRSKSGMKEPRIEKLFRIRG